MTIWQSSDFDNPN